MDAAGFRNAAHVAVDDVLDYHRTLHKRRVVPEVQPGYLKDQIPATVEQDPEPWEAIQQDIERVILPGMTHWQHPGFMAYYPADTSYEAMLGELYAAAWNTPGFNWICSPVSTELEVIVMDAIAKMINLPKCFLSDSLGGGMITGTASEATICAIIAAKNRVVTSMCTAENLEFGSAAWENRAFEIQSRLVVLSSDQTHSCTQKGAIVTGTRYRSVTTYAADGFTLHPVQLQKTLLDCKREGLIPCFLTLSMGTTSTCAVDPIAGILDFLQRHPDIWVHIDAAYAGAALVCDEYHSLTLAFDKVDSFVFNMHKWLAVTFDASCVWFRDRVALTSSLSLSRKPPFLEYKVSSSASSDTELAAEPFEYNDWHIVLGRRFRALKVWFVLRSHGVKKLQEHVRRGIRLAGLLYNLLQSRIDLFDIFSGPTFGLVTFSVKPFAGLQDRAPIDGSLQIGASNGCNVTAFSGQQPDVHAHAGIIPCDTATNGDVQHSVAYPDETAEVVAESMNKGQADLQTTNGTTTPERPTPKRYDSMGEGVLADASHDSYRARKDRLTNAVLDSVNASGAFFLTETTVDKTLLIRVSCGGQNTETQHIMAAFEAIVQASEGCRREH